MAYLYILYSSKLDRYYIGSTQDLERRVSEHNRGQTTSTKSGRPWSISFIREFPDATEAKRQETKLKRSKSRIIVESLIKQNRTG